MTTKTKRKMTRKFDFEALGIFLMGIFALLFVSFYPLEVEMAIFMTMVFIVPSLFGGGLMMMFPKPDEQNKQHILNQE